MAQLARCSDCGSTGVLVNGPGCVALATGTRFLGMDASRFQALQDYVEFTPDCAQRLRALHAAVETELPLVIDDFYAAISRDPGARAVITGGKAQVERLKATLNQWLVSLLLGARDEAYVAARSRIGQVHVRINLSQEYMLTAMSRLRIGLLRLGTQRLAPQDAAATGEAVNRALDLELALMLDTYRADSAARVDASARLAAVGQVAASIGHELRNPLGVVESSLYLTTQRLTKLELRDPVLDKHLPRAQEQLRVCANTIASLLDMVRDAPLVRGQFALAPLVEECLARTPRGSDVTVSVDIDAALQIYADRSQLGAVISNLTRNAFEAVANVTVKEVTLVAIGTASGVELTVQDSGPGVDAAHRSQIFDALFTTRAKGTGLGLALSKKIVERHGGEIGLVPNPMQGARFRIWLPAAPTSLRGVSQR